MTTATTTYFNSLVKILKEGDRIKVNGKLYFVTDRVTSRTVGLSSLSGGKASAYALHAASAWSSDVRLESVSAPLQNSRSRVSYKTVTRLEKVL
jgi:hypothetical protein